MHYNDFDIFDFKLVYIVNFIIVDFKTNDAEY